MYISFCNDGFSIVLALILASNFYVFSTYLAFSCFYYWIKESYFRCFFYAEGSRDIFLYELAIIPFAPSLFPKIYTLIFSWLCLLGALLRDFFLFFFCLAFQFYAFSNFSRKSSSDDYDQYSIFFLGRSSCKSSLYDLQTGFWYGGFGVYYFFYVLKSF